MAQYTYEQLKGMTVQHLREIASGIEHDALKGFTTMHKDHLLPALCLAVGIDAHVHHVAHGEKKSKIKQQLGSLKKQRDDFIASKDYVKLAMVRDQMRTLKHQLRVMAR